MEKFSLFLKTAFVSFINAVCAGFFGLGMCFLDYDWLNYIQKSYRAVDYDTFNLAVFGLACAAGLFVVLTIRQFRASFLDRFFRFGEMAVIIILASICMIWFTPTRGKPFIKQVMDRMANRSAESVHQETGRNSYQNTNGNP